MGKKILILVLLLSLTIFCSCEINIGILHNYNLNRNNKDFFEKIVKLKNFDELEITRVQLYYTHLGESTEHLYEVECINKVSNENYHLVYEYFNYVYSIFISYYPDEESEEEKDSSDIISLYESVMNQAKEEGNYKLFTDEEIQTYIDKAKKKLNK